MVCFDAQLVDAPDPILGALVSFILLNCARMAFTIDFDTGGACRSQVIPFVSRRFRDIHQTSSEGDDSAWSAVPSMASWCASNLEYLVALR